MADIFTPPPYSSIFYHSAASPSSYTTNSSNSDGNTNTATATATSITAVTAKLMSEHKDLLNRHALCLTQLRKIFKEAESLRQENTNLRLANANLSNQVNLLIEATLKNPFQTQPFSDSREQYRSSSSSLSSAGESFEKERDCGSWSGSFSEKFQSPKSPIQSPKNAIQSPKNAIQSSKDAIQKVHKDKDENDTARVTLPKSISVISSRFQKSAGATGSNSASLRPAARRRAPSPVSGPQRVYVRGGSQNDGSIELEVYNQGMFKTELCNKWQETRSCPYGDHCQFAHGIAELRPVIRHPRYKTEVCRMVLSGDPCPYGHRCHFRHALTDEEKLTLPLKLD